MGKEYHDYRIAPHDTTKRHLRNSIFIYPTLNTFIYVYNNVAHSTLYKCTHVLQSQHSVRVTLGGRLCRCLFC